VFHIMELLFWVKKNPLSKSSPLSGPDQNSGSGVQRSHCICFIYSDQTALDSPKSEGWRGKLDSVIIAHPSLFVKI
jgi:hypothetical protein